MLDHRLTAALTGLAELLAAARDQLVLAIQSSAGAVIPVLAADPGTVAVAQLARTAFTEATRSSAAIAAGFLVIGLLASFSLGSADPSEQPADSTA